MQAEEVLSRYGITPQGCELGMILMDAEAPECRWQGSEAAEEIGRLLPGGEQFVWAYRALPGMKWNGLETTNLNCLIAWLKTKLQ